MHGWQANLKRTCAPPVTVRAMPETEIPPVKRGDLYLLFLRLWARFFSLSFIYNIYGEKTIAIFAKKWYNIRDKYKKRRFYYDIQGRDSTETALREGN